MDSLVIQIIMWSDGDTIRARVWSDADGRSDVRLAGSEEEVLGLVQRTIDDWRRFDGEGS